jgi:hypothetical protein
MTGDQASASVTEAPSPQKKKRFWHKEDRDWLAFIVSTLSVIIALTALGLTGYIGLVNVFRKVDDLRVVIGTPPMFTFTKGGDLTAFGTQELTFFNSGNRQVAVTKISALVTKLESEKSAPLECGAKGAYSLNFKGGSFVVRPDEIIIQKIEVDDGWFIKKGDTKVIPKWIFTAKPGDTFQVCLLVNITTLDNYSVAEQLLAYKYVLGDTSMFSFPEITPLSEKEKPILLLRRTAVRFSR